MKHVIDCEKVAKLLEGLLVLGCLPNSPAAKSGLRYGDIVTRVNGVPTKTMDDFYRARTLEQASMTMQVFRDGRFITISVAVDRSESVTTGDFDRYLGRSPKRRSSFWLN